MKKEKRDYLSIQRLCVGLSNSENQSKRGAGIVANLIALDWGLSSFRAYLLDDSGVVLQSLSENTGVLSIEADGFEQCLRQHLQKLDGITADSAIIASGMITSRQGWCETPYVACPASVGDLARGLLSIEMTGYGKIHFVPGVNQLSPVPDIMRGEETQLAGIQSMDGVTAILPGTHSKWAHLQDAGISHFKTFMTGEMYAILIKHSILGKTADSIWSEDAFRKGVQKGFAFREQNKGLLSELFQVRVQAIMGEIPDQSVASHLSGLLLGCEIADALQSGFETAGKKQIVGAERLANLYKSALSECGIAADIVQEDLAATGLFRIARKAELI
jgi:2-dehydro-3-deoxygalactonokinase